MRGFGEIVFALGVLLALIESVTMAFSGRWTNETSLLVALAIMVAGSRLADSK